MYLTTPTHNNHPYARYLESLQLQNIYAGTELRKYPRQNPGMVITYTREITNSDVASTIARMTVTYLQGFSARVEQLIQKWTAFKTAHPDEQSWYTTFHIPKHSGGLRRIDAPIDELKDLQRELIQLLQYSNTRTKEPFVHAHNAAYAYVPHRSALDAILTHQANESHWFLKLDIKDFFPSCTQAVVRNLLKEVIPLHLFAESPLLDMCFWNGCLPQGAVTSPFITNMLMVSLDYKINALVYNYNRRRVVYTRYADDMLFSCRETFDWADMQNKIQEILTPHGFQIKREKTRYGSRSGSNWNLGIMLNKDNITTLGHKEKDRMRAAVHNFLRDFKNGIYWTKEDVQILTGKLNYMRKIDPESVSRILNKNRQQLGLSYTDCAKRILNNSI